MSYISVDVNIEDIVSGMGRRDRIELFEVMQEDGYISKQCVITKDGYLEASAYADESTDEFNLALQKLFNNGWKLTSEQEQYIIELSKRF